MHICTPSTQHTCLEVRCFAVGPLFPPQLSHREVTLPSRSSPALQGLWGSRGLLGRLLHRWAGQMAFWKPPAFFEPHC